MNNFEFEKQAIQKTNEICKTIKDSLDKNAHRDSRKNGSKAINASALSERSGIKNIGKVLDREAVSMRTVLRILEALKSLAHERGGNIEETIEKISNIVAR